MAARTTLMLREAWAALGGAADLLELVEVTGNGAGLLPSTLPALPAMIAAVATSTLAASELTAARCGTGPGPVVIDAAHVAVAARSERHARQVGGAIAVPFAPLSRFWRASDGWLRLQANYPWHRERALRVLGCEGRPEAVEKAVRDWRAEDLENTLAAEGAVGYAVRSAEDWQAHPQGQAVASLPLLESTAGRDVGRKAGAANGATGVRVLDLTRVIAGPVATRTLAAWGADVLRVDSPNLPEIPALALDTLPGKRSAVLDFAKPSGRALIETLLSQADVLVHGYRPGALARFGLDMDDVAERHPHLSVVTLSAWGHVGPWAARRGFDSLVQCATGIARTEGEPDGMPGVLPAQVLDHATGYLAAAAALLAVARATRGDSVRSIRLSLAQTARWLQSSGAGDREPEREAPPDAYLIELRGPGGPVQLVGPPGRAGDLLPQWSSITLLGVDPAIFSDRPGATGRGGPG